MIVMGKGGDKFRVPSSEFQVWRTARDSSNRYLGTARLPTGNVKLETRTCLARRLHGHRCAERGSAKPQQPAHDHQ